MILADKLNALDKEVVLKQLKDAEVREFGTLNEELAAKIERICASHMAEDGPMIVAGGLNNNDFCGMLLSIVKEDAEKVLKGLGIVAWIAAAEEVIMYLPEGEEELAETVKAKAAELGMNVEVVCDIVNARLMRDGITCHVETLAAVADVVDGTYEAKTLVSAVKFNTSSEVVEVAAPAYVAFGTKAAEVVGDLAGAKAVQIGDVLYTPEELAEVVITKELALGDGVIKVYTDGCCLIDAGCQQLLASRKKSCGKCTFCREGLIQLYTRMKEIVNGKGDTVSPQIMAEIGEVTSFSCSCTLGNSGSAFTLETIKKFEEEYTDHIKRKKCTAGTCLAFVNMYIDPAKCTGCGKCIPACEDDFIEGLPGYIHMIEDLDCTKCGKCMEVCEENAIVRTTNRVPRIPDRLTKVGRFKRY